MAVKTNKKINGNNYYRTSLFLGYTPQGTKKYKEFYGRTKTEAESKKQAFLNNGKQELSSEPLGNAVHSWLFEVIKLTGIKGGTFDRYVLDYEKGIQGSEIEWLKLKDIRGEHIQKYYNNMNSDGKTYNMILRTNKLLKRFFEYAVGKDYILKNPCTGVLLPDEAKQKYIEAKKKISIFTDYELEKIKEKAYLSHPVYGCVIDLLVLFGAREGEILGLRHQDIHKDYLEINCTLRKEKNYTSDKFEFVLNDAKNETSLRRVYFSDKYNALFRKAKVLQNEQILKNPSYDNCFNLVFTTESGTPIDSRNFIRFWKRILEELKIPYRSPHKLRHTFISKCAEKNVPKDIVQAIVGHRHGSKITDLIYTHRDEETIKESFKKILK